MNILTFDIEEWYIEQAYHGGRREQYQTYDRYLKSILDLLEERSICATFFCVGNMAVHFPQVVRLIADHGHEVGCHSHSHHWLTKMTPEELRRDTLDALHALQDVSGQPVESYRAPAFSIGEQNKWAFPILAECGIKRDASVFPMPRDFGGFASFPSQEPVLIDCGGAQIQEFPIGSTKILGREVAYSGGGYFRFFPLWYLRKKIKHSPYVMTYFHIGDLMHKKGGVMSRAAYETYFKEPGTLPNRLKRYVKSNLGTAGAFSKMSQLIRTFNFISLEDAGAKIAWNKSITL